jgi:hypothetical protein
MDIHLSPPEFVASKIADPSLAKSAVEIFVAEIPSTPGDKLAEEKASQTQAASKTTLLLLQRAAWEAVTSSSKSYTFQDVTIQNIGAISSDESKPLDLTSKNPPEKFIFTGQIILFEKEELVADFYSYLGPPPDGSADNDVLPIYHMAVLKHELRLSMLFPDLAGTPFDTITINEPSLIYQVRRPLIFSSISDDNRTCRSTLPRQWVAPWRPG